MSDVRHGLVDTADGTFKCLCGAEFANYVEFWKHGFDVYLATVREAADD